MDAAKPQPGWAISAIDERRALCPGSRRASRSTHSTKCICCRPTAFNACLNTLEEPPSHAKFIFVRHHTDAARCLDGALRWLASSCARRCREARRFLRQDSCVPKAPRLAAGRLGAHRAGPHAVSVSLRASCWNRSLALGRRATSASSSVRDNAGACRPEQIVFRISSIGLIEGLRGPALCLAVPLSINPSADPALSGFRNLLDHQLLADPHQAGAGNRPRNPAASEIERRRGREMAASCRCRSWRAAGRSLKGPWRNPEFAVMPSSCGDGAEPPDAFGRDSAPCELARRRL